MSRGAGSEREELERSAYVCMQRRFLLTGGTRQKLRGMFSKVPSSFLFAIPPSVVVFFFFSHVRLKQTEVNDNRMICMWIYDTASLGGNIGKDLPDLLGGRECFSWRSR